MLQKAQEKALKKRTKRRFAGKTTSYLLALSMMKRRPEPIINSKPMSDIM